MDDGDDDSTNPYTTRDAFKGVNRKRLRGTLSIAMRVRSNQDTFESKGNPWTTTRADDYREREERVKLRQHQFEAYNGKLSAKDLSHVGQKPKPKEPWDFLSRDKPVHKPFDRPLTIREARQLDDWVDRRLGMTREELALPRQPRPKVDRKELSRQQRDFDKAEPRKSRKGLADFKRKRQTTATIKRITLLDDLHDHVRNRDPKRKDLGHFVKEEK